MAPAPSACKDVRAKQINRHTQGAGMSDETQREAMRLLLWHDTALGPVFVGRSADGRYHVIWKGESLGSYASVGLAVSDAAGGHTFSAADGVDLAALGLSDDPAEWSAMAEFSDDQ